MSAKDVIRKLKEELKACKGAIVAEKDKARRIPKKHQLKIDYLNHRIKENRKECHKKETAFKAKIQKLVDDKKEAKRLLRIQEESCVLDPDIDRKHQNEQVKANDARKKFVEKMQIEIKRVVEQNGGELEWQVCQVCAGSFKEPEHRPIGLPCGHTICTSCKDTLQRADSERTTFLRCPFDRKVNRYSAHQVLPENITISDYC